MLSQTRQNRTSRKHIPFESLFNDAKHRAHCKQPKHEPGRLPYGRGTAVSVGTGPRNSEWNPYTLKPWDSSCARPFHKMFPHQELWVGAPGSETQTMPKLGNWGSFPVQGPEHALSEGVAQRGCGMSITEDTQISDTDWSKTWATWSGQTCFK